MSSGDEGKDYVVSQAALEKIVRTAASGTTGVAPDKKVRLTVKQKDGAVAVQIQIAALYGSRLRELALAVQHICRGCSPRLPHCPLSVSRCG